MQGSGRNGWIGWLIFILIIFGGRLLPPVAAWLSQVTGLPITTPMLLVGLIVLSVIGSIVNSVARQATRARDSSSPGLPTPMTTSRPPTQPRPAPPPTSAGLPPTVTRLPPPRLPSGEQRLPGPPRFEPIIDPRILTVGIVGLLVLGAFFLVALALGGATP
jgi:hypothetical protein